ncbi:CYTH and CHAD domain-containing protein [Aestuariimicrobium sp. T2.26MG-19.2B]|uniref:CYTH and CHAD domain-containing protein n=1 Tax=Aestuariimicrobium sp. T2.26MG-19.2B TaxID=3040679 RepID=UPI0024777CB0|nr:CYTH and CHAD domain-containing protein [Aestuariimicrobium sp. T2.26MG-19.2B]CAI9400744.1 putative protein [Aestuariimicrobium sp. T2.26MG-19.2B]
MADSWGEPRPPAAAPQLHVEVERKYDVDEETPLPDLTRWPGVASVDAPVVHELEAIHLDTPELALAASGVTLRRRTGGVDAGWTLKLPHGHDRRDELTAPLGAGDEDAPGSLQHLVRAWVRDATLMPVAKLTTHRTSRTLRTGDGSVLAEVSDDLVAAESYVGKGTSQAWREWEVELADAGGPFLEAVEKALLTTGARVAAHPSKFARTLGSSYPQHQAPHRKGPASAVMLDYLRQQVDTIKAMDPAVRDDEPDAVHQLRVAARSLRSALATYRPLIDRGRGDHLRAELKWLAGEVGRARDLEVSRERLHDLIAGEPDGLAPAALSRHVDDALDEQSRQARTAGLAALDGDRYRRLLDEVDDLLASPPLRRRAGRRAAPTVATLVTADLERLRKAVRRSRAADNDAASLHEVRKCAKRLRYSAESAVVVHGKRARKLAVAAERIQDLLGDHQDTVVTRELLRSLARSPSLTPEDAFALGRLHAREERRGADDRAIFVRRWKHFRPKPLH